MVMGPGFRELSNLSQGSAGLEAELAALRSQLRAGQQALADWQGGPLAVAAVPGAGKSTGMAAAAAIAIARQGLHSQRQLLLVTFTRSAAANLRQKVRQNLISLGLPPLGFAVQTIHSLAYTIATRHPELSGVGAESRTLVEPQKGHRLVRTAVEQWVVDHPRLYQMLLEGQSSDGEETERLRRQATLRTDVLPELAKIIINEAKSSGITPGDLAHWATTWQQRQQPDGVDYNGLAIAAGLYERYQALLEAQGWMDYDDMILGALRVLETPTAQGFWRSRIFAIFEDEAQDSSPLQTQLLVSLAADPSDASTPLNLVRVGDPNQAINSTFTPADPVFFNQFCNQAETQGCLIRFQEAGRSAQPIIDTANTLLTWVNQTLTPHPFRPQAIKPTPGGDPQRNPAPIGQGVEFHRPANPTATVQQIAQRLLTLYHQDPQRSFAILVRNHQQGAFINRLFQDPQTLGVDLWGSGLKVYDGIAENRHSQVPAELLALLQFMARPHSPDRLKALLKLLIHRQRIPSQDVNRLISQPEQWLYPGPLDTPPTDVASRQAQQRCRGLLRAKLELPPPSLIPFAALTLGYTQAELATADKLTTRLTQETRERPTLAALITALEAIVGTEKFTPVETEDRDERFTRPGYVTLLTMHKAKGLDWDVVFVPFLYQRVIPGESWVPQPQKFLGEFGLGEVVRAQIREVVHGHFAHQDLTRGDVPLPPWAEADSTLPDSAAAWKRAKHLKQAEEYRLLYVAMTRAKVLLWLSASVEGPDFWSRPDLLSRQDPCPALAALFAT